MQMNQLMQLKLMFMQQLRTKHDKSDAVDQDDQQRERTGGQKRRPSNKIKQDRKEKKRKKGTEHQYQQQNYEKWNVDGHNFKYGHGDGDQHDTDQKQNEQQENQENQWQKKDDHHRHLHYHDNIEDQQSLLLLTTTGQITTNSIIPLSLPTSQREREIDKKKGRSRSNRVQALFNEGKSIDGMPRTHAPTYTHTRNHITQASHPSTIQMLQQHLTQLIQTNETHTYNIEILQASFNLFAQKYQKKQAKLHKKVENITKQQKMLRSSQAALQSHQYNLKQLKEQFVANQKSQKQLKQQVDRLFEGRLKKQRQKNQLYERYRQLEKSVKQREEALKGQLRVREIGGEKDRLKEDLNIKDQEENQERKNQNKSQKEKGGSPSLSNHWQQQCHQQRIKKSAMYNAKPNSSSTHSSPNNKKTRIPNLMHYKQHLLQLKKQVLHKQHILQRKLTHHQQTKQSIAQTTEEIKHLQEEQYRQQQRTEQVSAERKQLQAELLRFNRIQEQLRGVEGELDECQVQGREIAMECNDLMAFYGVLGREEQDVRDRLRVLKRGMGMGSGTRDSIKWEDEGEWRRNKRDKNGDRKSPQSLSPSTGSFHNNRRGRSNSKSSGKKNYMYYKGSQSEQFQSQQWSSQSASAYPRVYRPSNKLKKRQKRHHQNQKNNSNKYTSSFTRSSPKPSFDNLSAANPNPNTNAAEVIQLFNQYNMVKQRNNYNYNRNNNDYQHQQ